jgi:hypothetical protein
VVERASAVTDDGYPNTFSSFGQNGTVTQEQLLGLIGGTAPLPMSLLMNPVPHLKELPLNVTLRQAPWPVIGHLIHPRVPRLHPISVALSGSASWHRTRVILPV